MAAQSDWRDAFTRTIVDGTKREIAESELRTIVAKMKTIKTKFPLLNDDTNPDLHSRRTTASIIHTALDEIIEIFEYDKSLMKEYPLVSVPILVDVAALIAFFSPVIRTLNPVESETPQLSCKMLDVLIDYRPRLVYERLNKLKAPWMENVLVKVRAKPYSPTGYNQTNTMRCHSKGCEKPWFSAFAGCLKDEFGDDELYTIYQGCWEDYASYVRHSVEEIFPVEALESVCINQEPRKPTGESVFCFTSWNFISKRLISLLKCQLKLQLGSGWLTISIRKVVAVESASGAHCDSHNNLCDPYVKLLINDKEVYKTRAKLNRHVFDDNVRFVSEIIPKSSKIKIEVWDDDSQEFLYWSEDDLIQREEGDIESFIKAPIRYGAHNSDLRNSLEVAVFWRDEYKYNEKEDKISLSFGAD